MTAAAAARRLPRSRLTVTVAALVIVIAALAVAIVVLGLRARSAQAVQGARTASLAAARQEVPVLLSYSYQEFGSHLARAEADTTGTFRATYRKLMTGQVEPTAMSNHVVTQASVSAGSVISAEPGSAVLLLFLSEQTKTDAKRAAVLNDNAVRVTMSKVGGRWLIAGLTPRS